MNDHFAYDFDVDLVSGKINEQTRVSDLKTLYPKSRINSDLDIKSTLVGKDIKDVYLSEYIPVGKKRVDGSHFFNLDDLKEKILE